MYKKHEELNKYIRQATEGGLTSIQIQQELLAAGWTPDDFRELLPSVSATTKSYKVIKQHIRWTRTLVSFFTTTGFAVGGLLAYLSSTNILPPPKITTALPLLSPASAVPTTPTPSLQTTLPPQPRGTYITATTCDKFSTQNLKDQCLFEVAIGSQDQETCGKITNLESREQCLVAVVVQRNELPKCNDLSIAEFRHNCIAIITTRMAVKNRDITTCDSILEELRPACQTAVAVTVLDPALCRTAGGDQMNDIFTVPSCIGEIAAAKGSANDCEMITSAAFPGECLRQVAIATKNLTLCQTSYGDRKIEDHRFWCHTQYAIKNEDAEVCQEINEPTYRDDCYRETAENLVDEKICDHISGNDEYSSQTKGECQRSVQKDTVLLNNCGTFDNPAEKDACYTMLAKSLMKPAICRLASSPQAEKECREWYPKVWYSWK